MPSSKARAEPLTAMLLRLLAHQPQHAYSLSSSLSALGFEIGDRSGVYQRLHALERRLLVTSHWETLGHGPARRVYRVTDAGLDSLKGTAAEAVEE